jgi:cell division septum initiation protein DivIVA
VNETLEHMVVAATSEPSAEHQALQVLTLAQRTSEEHVASARREAERIRAEAHATAEQIVRDAQAHAQVLQQEAERSLSEAHASAAQIAREAQIQAEDAARNAEDIVAKARSKADEMAKTAQANADELKHQAQQRYEDVVGSLAARREGLQRQIEALEQFDQDYRSRLTTFMQNQLRALWVDEPRAAVEELEEEPQAALAAALPPQRSQSDES